MLIQKDGNGGAVVGNYMPIVCLTRILSDKLYRHLIVKGVMSDEQKRQRKESRGTKDQLLIDKAVLREARAKTERHMTDPLVDCGKSWFGESSQQCSRPSW